MKSIPIHFFATLISLFALLNPALLVAAGASELAEFHETIKSKFDSVRHINAENLLAMPKQSLVIFDIREEAEFSVSHLEGAIRVSPDISRVEFLKTYSESLENKTLILYCSVGYRSSALAQKIQTAIPRYGATGIFNLEGGIFGWHNQQRQLVNRKGISEDIHPYDKYWGRLLVRTENIQYQSVD